MIRYGLLFALLAASSAFANTAHDTAAKLERLNAEMRELEKSVESRVGERASLQRTLRQDEREIARIAASQREVAQRIASLTARVSSLGNDQQQLSDQIAQERSLLIRLIREQYRQGRQPRAKLLLGDADAQAFDRMLHYYDHLSGLLKQRVVEYQRMLSQFDQNTTALSESQASLRSQESSLSRQENDLKQAYQKRLKTLDTIEKSIGDKRSLLAKLTEDRKQLEQLLIEIERSLAENLVDIDVPSITKRKGSLDWPITGKLALKFGSQKSTLSRDGVFISSVSGQPVKVVHAGRVVFSEWLRGYGLLLIVDHGEGYLSLYGHNQSLLRNTGDWVQTGETVALTGRSGGYDQSGLYFSMRRDGKSFDPSAWLQQ